MVVYVGSQSNSGPTPLDHNDIKVVYHPSAKMAEKIFHFEDYKPYLPKDESSSTVPPNPKPWKPFRSRLDFELAEFMHDAHFNESQSTQFLSLIRQCIETPSDFMFKDVADLKNCWDHARQLKATTVSHLLIFIL